MNSQIKAVIFDFDGLLVNTEELRLISFQRLLKKYKKKFKRQDYLLSMLSRHPLSTSAFLKEKYQLDVGLEKLHKERLEIFDELFHKKLVFKKGAFELIIKLRDKSIKCAIATGRRRYYIDDALSMLGVAKHFQVVVSPEDLIKSEGKPDPEIYLIAAEKLGVEPCECLVLEDAPHGIEAAKAAGMKAIYVPDARFVDTFHEKADLILKNMHELTDEVLGRLIHG